MSHHGGDPVAAALSPRAERAAACLPLTGIGLRAPHQREILAHRPHIGLLEAHCENYFGHGVEREMLASLRADYPLSLHGVGLSLGSTDPLDARHLGELAALVHELEPCLVSEHLSFSGAGGRFVNDLLPLPYTEEALLHMIRRVREVQDFLERQILIENIASYLGFADSSLSEWEFLAALATESRCGILLDVNNVHVSAMNHSFDPCRYIEALPVQAVGEIHLAGHRIESIGGREIRIDTHDQPVCEAVWDLLRTAVTRFGAVPTLVEWDAELPPLSVLLAQAHKADHIREEAQNATAA